MEVKILSGVASIYKESPTVDVISFGKIAKGGSARVQIKIEGVDSSTLSPTCGCTTTASTEKNVYDINYTETNNVGVFVKTLVLTYAEGGNNKTANVKISGNITN